MPTCRSCLCTSLIQVTIIHRQWSLELYSPHLTTDIHFVNECITIRYDGLDKQFLCRHLVNDSVAQTYIYSAIGDHQQHTSCTPALYQKGAAPSKPHICLHLYALISSDVSRCLCSGKYVQSYMQTISSVSICKVKLTFSLTKFLLLDLLCICSFPTDFLPWKIYLIYKVLKCWRLT